MFYGFLTEFLKLDGFFDDLAPDLGKHPLSKEHEATKTLMSPTNQRVYVTSARMKQPIQ